MRWYSSVVEHSTADREVTVPGAPYPLTSVPLDSFTYCSCHVVSYIVPELPCFSICGFMRNYTGVPVGGLEHSNCRVRGPGFPAGYTFIAFRCYVSGMH
ncbi:hypothetical protein AVEN_213810-1 [Araneus ventricosus]|uniref:Uncharacterized protein n=1 Tax=Araneus ventricosus TaxID=182803 RepID=A0A4Y2GJH3_ARAVE|nr:hypothetical protein AVEN_213810-1 [Araneus ventricosus]